MRSYKHSCGELRTLRKYKYGRLEARLKTPRTTGDNPDATSFISSLFMYDGHDGKWRELDWETQGDVRKGYEADSNYIFGNNAENWGETRKWGAWEAQHQSSAKDKYIVYGIEWTPDHVSWLLDGQEVRRLNPEDLNGNPLVKGQHQGLWTPETVGRIMMNFWIPTPDVGPNFGGDPSGNHYPLKAEYDWYRFYAYTPGCKCGALLP